MYVSMSVCIYIYIYLFIDGSKRKWAQMELHHIWNQLNKAAQAFLEYDDNSPALKARVIELTNIEMSKKIKRTAHLPGVDRQRRRPQQQPQQRHNGAIWGQAPG